MNYTLKDILLERFFENEIKKVLDHYNRRIDNEVNHIKHSLLTEKDSIKIGEYQKKAELLTTYKNVMYANPLYFDYKILEGDVPGVYADRWDIERILKKED